MRGKVWAKRIIGAGAVVAVLLTQATPSWGQGPEQPVGQQMDLATVGALLQKAAGTGSGLARTGKRPEGGAAVGERRSPRLLKKELEIAKIATGSNGGSGKRQLSSPGGLPQRPQASLRRKNASVDSRKTSNSPIPK